MIYVDKLHIPFKIRTINNFKPKKTSREKLSLKESKNWEKTNPLKSESPIWKSFKHYRGKIKTNGLSGKKLRYFGWDNTHNEIEMYDRFGKPIDALDPVTGNRLFKRMLEAINR